MARLQVALLLIAATCALSGKYSEKVHRETSTTDETTNPEECYVTASGLLQCVRAFRESKIDRPSSEFQLFGFSRARGTNFQ